MDAIYVGIDVSKDRLDVALRPSGENFAVARTVAGIDDLIERLKTSWPTMVAIEATGGFETLVAGGLAGAGLPVVVRHRSDHLLRRLASAPRQTLSMPW